LAEIRVFREKSKSDKMSVSPQRKRMSSGGTISSPSKKSRTILSPQEKQEIFEIWENFKNNKATSPNRHRKAKPNVRKPPHNNNYVTASWKARPQRFRGVSHTTWKTIIKSGLAGIEFRTPGHQRTLDNASEKTLAEHIKKAAFEGHLLSNNAIRIWALDILKSSEKFKNSDNDGKLRLLSKIGGKKWVQKFKERHAISLSESGSALELPRAQKSQPENLIEFYRELMTVHAVSQVHFEARRLLESDVTLEGINLNLDLPFPSPSSSSSDPGRTKPPKHTAASVTSAVRRNPENSSWQPGLSEPSDMDFFFQTPRWSNSNEMGSTTPD
jgi:hypothetical protein